jgi:hypothetical protein
MKSSTCAMLTALAIAVLSAGVPGTAAAQPSDRSPQLERQIVDTVNGINNAFLRGELKELLSYMHDDVTMLHGHERINNVKDAQAEWTKLFELRRKTAMAYNLRIRDLKAQIYGSAIVVTFSYDHPRLSGARITNESGKAVYVLLRQSGATENDAVALEQKKPIVMVHCSVIADRTGGGMPALP